MSRDVARLAGRLFVLSAFIQEASCTAFGACWLSNTNLVVSSKTIKTSASFLKLLLYISKRSSRTRIWHTIYTPESSAAYSMGISVARVSRLTVDAAILVFILVLSAVATQLAVLFFEVLGIVGAVLNDMIFRTSLARRLASQIIVRVAWTHLAVSKLVVIYW